MARKIDRDAVEDVSKSSDTSAAELSYQQSRAAVDLLAKDEDARLLRIRIQLLGDDIGDLNEKLLKEQQRGEGAEAEVQTLRSRTQELCGDFDSVNKQLQLNVSELQKAEAELASLQSVSSDSTKVLTQKLALERELANIKPELEHLRSTATSNQGLLSEKLSLERQLGTVQAELEDSKNALQSARLREGKSHSRNVDHDEEVAGLQKELAKAQRDLSRASKRSDPEGSQRIEELETLLAKETHARESAEESLSATSSKTQNGHEVQTQLDAQQREFQKLQTEFRKAQQAWDAEKAVLEDKLNQFRIKLRSTKDKLKEAEGQLAEKQSAPLTAPVAKNSRKRSAAQMDPDAAIGTPGDGAQAKRSKRSTSMLGEKSTFSITPFLNRQSNVVPGDVADAAADEPVASIEDVVSPSVAAAATKKQSKPLAKSSPGKANPKVKAPTARRTTAKMSLVSVPEEEEENALVTDLKKPVALAASIPAALTKEPTSDPIKKPKLALKPRRTLDSFASFREGSLPPQPLQQKKKRKLGGGTKTLFDEDDDEDAVAPAASKISGPQRAFGALSGGLKRLAGPGAGKSKGNLVVAEGGFTFSPLKRNPRAPSIQPGA